jgi:large subunit ribosomal protein L10
MYRRFFNENKAMPNNIKIEEVKVLREKVARAKSVLFAEYHGLNANKINKLRAAVKESGAEMSIGKNTLLRVALDEEKIGSKEATQALKGPVATIFSYTDAISPIKVVTEFAKEFDLPTIKAGIISGEFTNAAKIKILSELPSRDELIATIVGRLKSPLVGITNVLAGTQRNFVYALSAIADKKAKE